MKMSRGVLLRIRNVLQTKTFQKMKIHILCSITSFLVENRAVYEIMWKNIVEPDRSQMTIWRTHIASWITKTTNTHSEYVILLFHRNNGYSKVLQCDVISTLPVLLIYIIRTIPILLEYRTTDKVQESGNGKSKVPSSGPRRVAYLFWGGTRPTHHSPAPPCLLCGQHTQGSVRA